jgi:beta-phosphoglucomutase-like phosphatase (HAD superfamily)
MVKAVIFDMDGTLIDSVDLHAKAWQDAFRDFGHEFELKAIRDQIGKGGDQLLPIFLTREQIDTQGPDLEKHRGHILKERYLSQIKAFPKVTELFHRIRADSIKSFWRRPRKRRNCVPTRRLLASRGWSTSRPRRTTQRSPNPILISFRLPWPSLGAPTSPKSLLSATRPTMPRLPARPV